MLVQNANDAFPKRYFKNPDVNLFRHVQTECDVNRKSNSTEQIVFYTDSLLSYM